MGIDTVTIQNLEIVAVDVENNVILIKGNVPGANKSLVIIKTAVKNPGKINEREELISYTENDSTVENNESATAESEN